MFVCLDSDKRYLAAFTTENAARKSWEITCSNMGRPSFNRGVGEVETIVRNPTEKLLGYIRPGFVLDFPAHL